LHIFFANSAPIVKLHPCLPFASGDLSLLR
jgi:hypothetical protein